MKEEETLAGRCVKCLIYNLHFILDSVEIKQEPTEDEVVTENGQVKDEDDAKEAGELVSWKFYHQRQILEGWSPLEVSVGEVVPRPLPDLSTTGHIENNFSTDSICQTESTFICKMSLQCIL